MPQDPRGSGRPDAIRVRTLTDFASFLRLAPVWDDLLERAGVDHPFLSHEWLRSWWEAFGAGRGLASQHA